MKKNVLYLGCFCIITLVAITNLSGQTAKLSDEKAGPISNAPGGKIAFIREGDLWVMNWDGRSQYKIVTAQNADGGISWAPDGRRIAFARKGQFEYRGPSGMDGGRHHLYDIFIGYLDSAEAQNTSFWRQLTFDNGCRYPHWTDDGSAVYCTYDLHGNTVNAMFANYQTARVDTSGAGVEVFRTDYDSADSLFVLMPTPGPDGMHAFILLEKTNRLGIGIAPIQKKTLKKAEIGHEVKFMAAVTAPAWSPDGKWIAFIDSDMSRMGLYITNPDLTERYLVFKPGPGLAIQTYQPSWSPDSKWLTFGLQDGSIWIIKITGEGLRQLTGSGLNIIPTWSKN